MHVVPDEANRGRGHHRVQDVVHHLAIRCSCKVNVRDGENVFLGTIIVWGYYFQFCVSQLLVARAVQFYRHENVSRMPPIILLDSYSGNDEFRSV